MTEYGAAGGRGARRSRSSSQTTAMGSPGMPPTGGDDRLAELEARLDRLEGEPAMRMGERSRVLMRRVMPADASKHFRNAAREQLLGFRAIVDFWIARVDAMESRPTSDNDRVTIDVE